MYYEIIGRNKAFPLALELTVTLLFDDFLFCGQLDWQDFVPGLLLSGTKCNSLEWI